MNHERKTGKPIDAHVVTWRGMMTKVGAPATWRSAVTDKLEAHGRAV